MRFTKASDKYLHLAKGMEKAIEDIHNEMDKLEKQASKYEKQYRTYLSSYVRHLEKEKT